MSEVIKESTLRVLREVIHSDPYHQQFMPLLDELERLQQECDDRHKVMDDTRKAFGLSESGIWFLRQNAEYLIKELRAADRRAERAERILAALREASSDIVFAANTHICRAEQVWDHNVKAGLRAAVTAAEQEVGQ